MWVTATVPTALIGSAFMFGARAELDLWRIGFVGTFDRIGVTPFTIGDTNSWSALLGYSLVSTEFFRVRGLAGFSALTGANTTTRFAPSLGTTARVLWHFIGAEGSASFTAGAFRQLDLRAAMILKGGVFELQLGYRARWIDATASGTIGSMFSTSARRPISSPRARRPHRCSSPARTSASAACSELCCSASRHPKDVLVDDRPCPRRGSLKHIQRAMAVQRACEVPRNEHRLRAIAAERDG